MIGFGWLKRKGPAQERRRSWHQAWSNAMTKEDGAAAAQLRAELMAFASTDGDVELEEEMVDALERIAHLKGTADTLPVVATQHRVIGHEPCHFTAPASLPADPSQPSGRVLLTATRSVFVGGGRTSAVAWHTVRHIARTDRDVIFARADGTGAAHYRFNTFADAAEAAYLARRLSAR